jgi:hypothetical protein
VLAAIVVAHTLLSLVWSNDEAVMNILFRSALWVTVPMWLIAIWIFQQLPWSQLTKGIVVGATILLATAGGIVIYQAQFHYSTYMSDDVLAAATFLKGAANVQRIGTNAESRAYWLSAYTGIPVAWVQPKPPAPAYAEATQLAECDLGWQADCATGYVSHWVIDKTHRQQFPVAIDRAPNPRDPWSQMGHDAPWLTLLWTRGNVEIWRNDKWD